MGELSTRDHPDWWRPVGGSNSQDSTLERRSLVWNDDGIEDGAVPPAFYTAETFKGKFFTRGCRGKIEQLEIYCIATAGGDIELRYSPHPCLGPIRTIIIGPGPAWAWVPLVIEEMWNYDSLFIWVSDCDLDVSWAYDAVEPHDGHESVDLGATWADTATRPFIRVVYTGETPGDVPVSGIINNIQIPNLASEVTDPVGISAPIGGASFYLVEGAGWISYALWQVTTLADSTDIAPRLRLDGRFTDLGNVSMTWIRTRLFQNSVEGWSFPQWDVAANRYAFQLVVRLPFRRTCEIGFSDCSGFGGSGFVWPLVELLC